MAIENGPNLKMYEPYWKMGDFPAIAMLVYHFGYFMQWSLWRLRPPTGPGSAYYTTHATAACGEGEIQVDHCRMWLWRRWNWWNPWPVKRQCCWPPKGVCLKNGGKGCWTCEMDDGWRFFQNCFPSKLWKLTKRNFDGRNPVLVLDCSSTHVAAFRLFFGALQRQFLWKKSVLRGHLLHRQLPKSLELKVNQDKKHPHSSRYPSRCGGIMDGTKKSLRCLTDLFLPRKMSWTYPVFLCAVPQPQHTTPRPFLIVSKVGFRRQKKPMHDFKFQPLAADSTQKLGGGFKYVFIFTPKIGEMIQLD